MRLEVEKLKNMHIVACICWRMYDVLVGCGLERKIKLLT
jgi:hypothetical protein